VANASEAEAIDTQVATDTSSLGSSDQAPVKHAKFSISQASIALPDYISACRALDLDPDAPESSTTTQTASATGPRPKPRQAQHKEMDHIEEDGKDAATPSRKTRNTQKAMLGP